MSGQREVHEQFAALAVQGFESYPVEFDSSQRLAGGPLLSVTEELADDAANIAATVQRIDPGAIRI